VRNGKRAECIRQKTHFHRLGVRSALLIFGEYLGHVDTVRFSQTFFGAKKYLRWCLRKPQVARMDLLSAMARRELEPLREAIRSAKSHEDLIEHQLQEARVLEEELVQIDLTLQTIRKGLRSGALDEFSAAALEDAVALGIGDHPDVVELRNLDFRASLPRDIRPPTFADGARFGI